MSILYSCLAVLLLNTWTVFHPNIPPKDQNKYRKWVHVFKVISSATVAPDAISTVAFSQWRCARKATKILQPMLPLWSIKHSFYAEMGGYRVVDKRSGQMYCFRPLQLAWLHKEKIIEIPEVSTEDIDDRSGADVLAKILACAQSTWFLVPTSARLQQKLTLTTLKILLLPYVAVTWMIYFFWWTKPLRMESYTKIPVESLPDAKLIQLAKATLPVDEVPNWWRPVPLEMHDRAWEFWWMEKPWDLKRVRVKHTNHLIPIQLHTQVARTMAESWVADWYRDAVNEAHPSEWDCWDDIVIYLSGSFIYGFGLVAWDYRFPTPAERIVWRVSVLTSCGGITIWVPLAFMLRWLRPGNTWKELPFYVLTVMVFAARLIIIAQVFAGLRLVPEGVFASANWSSYIPHV